MHNILLGSEVVTMRVKSSGLLGSSGATENLMFSKHLPYVYVMSPPCFSPTSPTYTGMKKPGESPPP